MKQAHAYTHQKKKKTNFHPRSSTQIISQKHSYNRRLKLYIYIYIVLFKQWNIYFFCWIKKGVFGVDSLTLRYLTIVEYKLNLKKKKLLCLFGKHGIFLYDKFVLVHANWNFFCFIFNFWFSYTNSFDKSRAHNHPFSERKSIPPISTDFSFNF